MDDPAVDSANRSEQSDPDATFVAVLDLVQSWEPVPVSTATKVGHLCSYLEQGLNDDDSPVWERDIVEKRRGSMAADLVVNGEIGLKLVGKTRSAGGDDLSVTLRLLSERYNYLVVYWLDASPAGADYRRNLERRISAHRSDVKALRFVERPCGESDPNDPGASTVGSPHPVGLLLAGSLAVVGSGLVTWLFTLTGGLARLFLSAVAGVFVLSLALGVFFVTH